jgi:hypothetical protein
MSSPSTARADDSRRLAVANGRVLAASVVAVIDVLGGEMWQSHRMSQRETEIFASPAERRRDYVCRERLVGAKSFTAKRCRSRSCVATTSFANLAIASDRSALITTGALPPSRSPRCMPFLGNRV